MASPPKPWERAGAGGTSTTALVEGNPASSPAASTATSTTSSTLSSNPPSLPARPNSLVSAVNQTAANYSTLNTNRFGSSSPYGYGSYGGYGGYSPYNRFGGGYGSMYGGYGGMGGMYGGMGGMYGGMGGIPGDPNSQSLTQSFSQSTQATFQLIESIVGAVGGFAQMLESTYLATQSSFFAMISVAEQFGNLRNTLGSVLGIFTLMRWIRAAIAKLTGRPPPASSKELTPAKFAAFAGKMPDGSPAPPAPSKKPFIMFVIAVFGLPYLMGKLIKALAKGQEEEERKRRESGMVYGGDQPIDASKLEFYRVIYDFNPDATNDAVHGIDLAVKKGDLVAILSKTDPLGNRSEWWRCRSRDGRVGYLPSPYLKPFQQRQQITSGSQTGSPAGSRAHTMTTTAVSAPNSRTVTLTDKVDGPEVKGKPGDISVESFQKGQFYS